MKNGIIKALIEKIDLAEQVTKTFSAKIVDRHGDRYRTMADSSALFDAVATILVFNETIRQVNMGRSHDKVMQFLIDELLMVAKHPNCLPTSDTARMMATAAMNAHANCLAEITDWPY